MIGTRRAQRQVLALLVVLCAACADEPSQDDASSQPTWLTQRPENAHAYADETLARFGRLVEGEGWRDAAWNAQGALEAVHVMTGLAFVLIPYTGSRGFLMGSPEGEDGRDEFEWQHWEIVGAFLLGKTECTQGSWRKSGGAERSHFESDDDRPVESVTWTECQKWCESLGLRLPTEAEWEYACRAGTSQAVYAGRWQILGERNAPALDAIAWYLGNSGVDFDREDGFVTTSVAEKQHDFSMAGTRKVGRKLPNPWGLHDMLGNVLEWCEDKTETYARTGEGGRVRLGEDMADRITRGGSWSSSARLCRAATRRWMNPLARVYIFGFRPAADLPR
jgi:formylglycine-generating enzyme required for sulfatase activity